MRRTIAVRDRVTSAPVTRLAGNGDGHPADNKWGVCLWHHLKGAVGRVRGAAVAVKDAVIGSASETAETGQRTAGSIAETVSDAPTAVARKAQGSPIAAGLIAFGASSSSVLPAARHKG
jgi:hypothetical protein